MATNLKRGLIFLIILVILIFVAVLFANIQRRGQSIDDIKGLIETKLDAKEYKSEGDLKINIKNGSSEQICFSSCYPYTLQTFIDDKWVDFPSITCENKAQAKSCIKGKGVKAFQLTLPETTGKARLSMGVCVNCEGKEFTENLRIYSEEFNIK